MNMAKLSIKGLIESALNLGRTLDSDYAPLQQFFVVMEHCLKHGLKSKCNKSQPKFRSPPEYSQVLICVIYTLKNKGSSKCSSSDAIEEPQRTIQSNVI